MSENRPESISNSSDMNSILLTPPDMIWGERCLSFSKKTLTMGVLNVTDDSFSDGGKFYSFDGAVAQGLRIEEEGADILDVGGESTRPFSDAVGEEEEIRRVVPVIEALSKRISIPISIDTNKAGVAERALDAGASILNDISAFKMDPAMAGVAAKSDVPVIIMHMKGVPKDMQVNPEYDDLFGEINAYFKEAVEFGVSRGIKRDKFILDPGVGFGKNIHHNLLIIKHVHRFHEMGMPVLIGHSRKTFIRKTLKRPEEADMSTDHPLVEIGSQAVASAAAMSGAHIIRMHNVQNTVATLKMIDAIRTA